MEAILNRDGVPTVRVLGSGKFVQSEGDLKIGVPLVDGCLPGPDESPARMRGEVKNHKSAPAKLFALTAALEPVAYTVEEKVKYSGLIKRSLTQRKAVSVAFIRDPKPASGVIKDLDPSLFAVVMRMDTFIELLKASNTTL